MRKQELAQRLALRGNIESAAAELRLLREQGITGASASLAEIAAYHQRWEDVFLHSRAILVSPSAVDTLNVYLDLVSLVARAAGETGDWDTAQKLAELARGSLSTEDRDRTKVEAIVRLAQFVDLRSSNTAFTLSDPDELIERRKARFEEAMEKLAANKSKRFKTPLERLEHVFGLARVYSYGQGAVDIFDREKALPNIFDNVAFTAAALVRCGRPEDAWSAIKARVHLWWPVEVTQIAPVVLLADGALGHSMTPQRCEWILRCPRGPESTQPTDI